MTAETNERGDYTTGTDLDETDGTAETVPYAGGIVQTSRGRHYTSKQLAKAFGCSLSYLRKKTNSLKTIPGGFIINNRSGLPQWIFPASSLTWLQATLPPARHGGPRTNRQVGAKRGRTAPETDFLLPRRTRHGLSVEAALRNLVIATEDLTRALRS